ncbi:hypothetical protein KY363_02015 [Candidatus Woesearchaeota archaeon]|nr:hypothetical protein [Candidatus Woesearchaeota archaeon]
MKKIRPILGRFIPTMQPTYASYEELMQAHGGRTYAEIKHDGYRVQVHKGRKRLKIFTRNGNELNYPCYPEIVQIAKQLPVCIIDAELVGEGSTHKEVYDNVKSRFRRPNIKEATINKYLESGIIDDTPLSLRLFDTLRFERKGLLDLPFTERTSYTDSFDIPGLVPVDHQLVRGVEDLEAVIEDTFKQKHEGLVCKNPDSLYHPGGNGIDWVKYKRSESLDLVIVGFYLGGSSELPFTSVLCATYNPDKGQYETLGKIGATRNGLAKEIQAAVKGKTSRRAPKNVAFSEKLSRDAYANHVPTMYIDPNSSVVLEVSAMNLYRSDNWQTCGLDQGKAFSMRIGYAKQLRPDKSPQQATTTPTIWKLYNLQKGEAE